MKAVGAWIFAGGFTLGVRQHFDVRCVLEEGPFGTVTASHNMPEIPIYVGEANWPLEELKAEGELDLIYGNPPCAAWSSAGGSAIQGNDWRLDPRVHCTRKLFGLLEDLRPKAWVWESVVPAFTRGRELVDELTARAVALGYSVTYLFHNSAHLGVPQQRRRFFFVATRFKFDIEDVFYDQLNADEVLGRLNDRGEPLDRDLRRFAWLFPKLRPGETMLKAWNRETPKPWPLNDRGQVLGRPNITIGRCPVGRPSQVVMSEMVHPTEDRGLSIKELAALCGYPPDYEFVGSGQAQQLGRGVCPPVGEWIARNFRLCLERNQKDPSPVVKSIDCRDLPTVTQLMPIPDLPAPGEPPKPWNITDLPPHVPATEFSFGARRPMPTQPTTFRPDRSFAASESRNTMSTPEGTISLEIPDELSQDSYDDFKDWMDLMFKRIERKINKRAAELKANGAAVTEPAV